MATRSSNTHYPPSCTSSVCFPEKFIFLIATTSLVSLFRAYKREGEGEGERERGRKGEGQSKRDEG